MGTQTTNGESSTAWSSGSGFREGTYIRVTWSATDFQEVSQVFASGAHIGGIAGQHKGSNRLICRYAANNYVRWEVRADGTWEWQRLLGGTFHGIFSGTLATRPGPGMWMRLRAGDKDTNNPALFQGYIGSQLIWQWEDPGGLTAIGAGNRGWGFGSGADGSIVTAQFKPAVIAQWMAKDQ